jgi:hypothetical protein
MSDIDPLKSRILEARDAGLTALPPLTAAMLGVNEHDRAWVDTKCTPQPIQCLLQPVALSGARERIGKKVYVQNIHMPLSMQGCPKRTNMNETYTRCRAVMM